MTGEEIIKGLALVAAWKHEHQNGVNGMLAVLFVLRNRVNDGWFNGDWMLNVEALFNSGPDDWTVNTQGIEEGSFPDVREPSFIKLMQYIDGVFDGTQTDTLTDGALYFCPTNSTDTQSMWLPVAVIGSTTYYKIKK